MTDVSRPLQGKCALITGSLQGLGLAAARRFAAAGCHILLSGLAEPESAETIRRALESDHGIRARYSSADLRDPSQIEAMVRDAEAAFDTVDVLVNNAVVRHAASVEDFGSEHWEAAIAVNLSAAFHTTRLVLPGMRRRQWGPIINVSSIYGLRGAPNRIGYVTTKTALLGMTRAVALETAGSGITCNAICPGTSDTPVHQAALERLMTDGTLSRADAERTFFRGKQPTARFIPPESVAGLMLYLCGPDATEITGAEIPVDGGWSIS